jgi:hypothetical protein
LTYGKKGSLYTPGNSAITETAQDARGTDKAAKAFGSDSRPETGDQAAP